MAAQTNETLQREEKRFIENSELHDEKKCFKSFDPKLVVYKGFYFFFYSALGSLLPYLTVYYKQLGLSAQQTGALIGVRPLIQLIAQPAWGSVADTYKKSKVIFILSLFAWLASFSSICIVSTKTNVAPCKDNGTTGVVASILNQEKTKLDGYVIHGRFHNGSYRQFNTSPQTQNAISNNTTISSKDTFVLPKIKMSNKNAGESDRWFGVSDLSKDNSQEKNEYSVKRLSNNHRSTILRLSNPNNERIQKVYNREQEERVFDSLNMEAHYPWPLDTLANYDLTQESHDWYDHQQLYVFVMLFVITVVGMLIAAPSGTLADIATLRNLDNTTEQYGKQRLWGPAGWGLGSFIVGSALTTTEESHNCNSPLHVDYTPCFYAFVALLGAALIFGLFFDFDEKSAQEGNLREGFKIFYNCQFIYFTLTLLYCGFALGTVQTFLFWHVHNLGGTQFLLSCISGVQSASETLMYLISGPLIQRFGYEKILYCGLVSYIIRFWVYAFVSDSWLVLPLELLYGVASAGVWTAAVCYIGLIPGASSTIQGLIGGIYWGLGVGAGGVIGGFIVSYIGLRLMFVGFGILSIVDLSLYILVNNCQQCQGNICVPTSLQEKDSEGCSRDYSLLSNHDEDLEKGDEK